MVEKAEQLLLDYGFHQVRVRIHGSLARIEIMPEEFPKLLEKNVREDIAKKFKEYGFTYVTMDILGYRMGKYERNTWRNDKTTADSSLRGKNEMTVKERIAALRARMKETGIDAYLIPTDDFHGSEYVGEYFKCRKIYHRIYRFCRHCGDHAGYGRIWTDWTLF